MHINLLDQQPIIGHENSVYFIVADAPWPEGLSNPEKQYLARQKDMEQPVSLIQHGEVCSWLVFIKNPQQPDEEYRKTGSELARAVQKEKISQLSIEGSPLEPNQLMAFAEGFALTGYRFLKYVQEPEKKKKFFTVTQLDVFNNQLPIDQVIGLNNLLLAVFWARDLVNEPVNVMNATRFAQEVTLRGQESGFTVEVLDKKQIESLRMGGLLAVNRGSIDPPTFTICEWKPKDAVNKKPFVLVGKGVMYDTGGLSLKPTSSMDTMKSDMAGAAAVAATLYTLALNEQPVWVIGLLPATDNRPDGNAYVPGDVIRMYNGLHVEVLNTDAEGRLILADALSYAGKYEPELIIDLATLTGNAVAAIGTFASVFMGNADNKWFSALEEAGTETNERLVRFPFWKEYNETLKSEIADLKNIGGKEAGAITAGKFLEHFTTYPYIHIDIAGPSFISSEDGYRLKGGTGVGVRLLAEFFKKVSNQ